MKIDLKHGGETHEIEGTPEEIAELLMRLQRAVVLPPEWVSAREVRLPPPVEIGWVDPPGYAPGCICGNVIMQVGPVHCPTHGYLGTAGETYCGPMMKTADVCSGGVCASAGHTSVTCERHRAQQVTTTVTSG